MPLMTNCCDRTHFTLAPLVLIATVLALLVIPAAPARSYEAGTASAPFLLSDVGARAAAMGGAATGGPAPQDLVYYNPAGLAFIGQKTIALQHIEDVSGDNYEYATYIQPLMQRFGIGLSTSYVYYTDSVRTEFETLSNFTDYDLGVGFSFAGRVTPLLALGGTATVLQEKLYIYRSTTMVFDMGVLYQTPFEGLSLGFVRKNMGRGLRFLETRSPLPVVNRAGLAYQRPGSPWRITSDAVHVAQQKMRYNLGLSRDIGRLLTLRAGYRFRHDGREASGVTAGVGIHYGDIAFDYAYTPSPAYFELGGTHRIQSALSWGARDTRPAAPRDTRPAAAPEIVEVPAKSQTSNFHGTYSLGTHFNSIANRSIVGYAPSLAPRLDLVSVGMVGQSEATIAVNGYYDSWDRLELQRVTAGLSNGEVDLTAGDFVAQMSPYTIVGREMRGAEASYTVKRARKLLPAPGGEDLRGEGQPALNVGKWLRESGFGQETFKATTVRALAGQTAEATNVGDRVEGLNGVRATYGTFEQFTAGAEVEAEVVHNTFLTLRTVHVVDDRSSLNAPGVTTPLTSTVIAAAAEKIFPSGKLKFISEVAYSLFDKNTYSALVKAENDVAWNARLSWRPGKWLVEPGYEHIGTDFDLGGNISMRSMQDRSGPKLVVAREMAKWLRFRFDGSYYHDNLERKDVYTTRTFDGRSNFDFSLPKNVFLTLSYATRLDKSGVAVDTTATLQRVNTRTEMWQVSARGTLGRVNLSGSLSSSVNRNHNLYTAGVLVGGYKIHGLSFMIDGPLTARSDFYAGYFKNRTNYAYPDNSTIYEQYSGRVNVRRVMGKHDVFVTMRYSRNKGATQKEIRREDGCGLRALLNASNSLTLEYKHVTDQYTPVEPSLNFRCHSYDVLYTHLF